MSEKTFDPTPGRIRKARREGNIPRSAEINGVVGFGAALLTLTAVVPLMWSLTSSTIAQATRGHADPVVLVPVLIGALAPAVATAFAAVVTNVVQSGGLVFVVPTMKLERLRPDEGIKKIVSRDTVITLARATLAFAIALLSLIPTVRAILDRATLDMPPEATLAIAASGSMRVAGSAILVAFVFAIVDLLVVRASWKRKLRMDFQEVKREMIENDGDPLVRQRRRSMHRSFLAGSVNQVREASFVITNPTHLAVAVAYRPPEIDVPRVLVMGADESARRIRELAGEYGIRIIENKPLAWLLWENAKVGKAIPRETFIAVAEIVHELGLAGQATS